MFASTSPSYLILQSLDAGNDYLSGAYPEYLENFLPLCSRLKTELVAHGYSFIGNEPLKLTIDCKSYGYTGIALSQHLKSSGIYVEFSDPDYLVLMLTPEIGVAGLQRLKPALTAIPQKPAIANAAPIPAKGNPVMSPRQAAFCPSTIIPVTESLGRVLASPSVGCPPAVPIVVCGEEIDQSAIDCFTYYGIETCCVTNP